MEGIIVAAIVAAVSAIATTAIGAYASRKFGLPGVARRVDDEQDSLIETLETALDEARTQAAQAKTIADEARKEARASERKRLACEQDIRELKRDLRDTEEELLDLYRRTGRRPPTRLEDRHSDHVTETDE